MKSYVKDGNVMTFIAPRAVASGEGFLVGAAVAFAQGAAASGAAVEGLCTGVVTHKANTAVATAFQRAYWDNSAFEVTSVVGANTLIGVFPEAKAAGVLVATVRLNGAF